MIRLAEERAASLRGAIADVRLAYAEYLATGKWWKWKHAHTAALLAHHLRLEHADADIPQ